MEIKNLKGVGPKTSEYLNKLNIFDIKDLLLYYPFRYNIFNVSELSTLDNITVKAILESDAKVFFIKKNFNRLTFRARVENKIINVSIFNRSFLKNNLIIGREVMLYGKYDETKNTFIASDIKFETFSGQRIEPVYHLIKGISNKDIMKLVNNALILNLKVDDYVPETILEKYSFIDKMSAIKIIHQPANLDILKKAKLRLIYEELFVFMYKINILKRFNKKAVGIKRDVSKDKLDEFIKSLPFEMTGDQIKASLEIFEDLNSNKKMNRLLLGDVGSGKTIVGTSGMYLNYLSGYQSVLMAPTEILAVQHYYNIKGVLEAFGVSIDLLVGSMKKSEKNNVIKRLVSGEIDILIGTHAVLSDNVEFKNLGLVITDEQHRFGVNQRSILHDKGFSPDVLYMSATPIPRTYALTLYGDMDTSIIKEKPKGRKDIETFIKKESDLKEVLFKLLEEIKHGHQIYVVAPVIEEGESNLYDVNDLRDKFNTAFNGKVSIEILHGKVKQVNKDAIMNDFKNGKISILISTTVIEVGIDVKNATTMVIFNAERFGLATLHQLRGRVGRGDLDSYCYLISDMEVERLKVMTESNDGFYIAEQDFMLRGEGDLFGVKQSGDMVFKIADLKRDFKILMQAKEDSEYILNSDNFYPLLKDIEESLILVD